MKKRPDGVAAGAIVSIDFVGFMLCSAFCQGLKGFDGLSPNGFGRFRGWTLAPGLRRGTAVNSVRAAYRRGPPAPPVSCGQSRVIESRGNITRPTTRLAPCHGAGAEAGDEGGLRSIPFQAERRRIDLRHDHGRFDQDRQSVCRFDRITGGHQHDLRRDPESDRPFIRRQPRSGRASGVRSARGGADSLKESQRRSCPPGIGWTRSRPYRSS